MYATTQNSREEISGGNSWLKKWLSSHDVTGSTLKNPYENDSFPGHINYLD